MPDQNLPELIKDAGILGKIWDDIFSPSAKKLGIALGGVTGTVLSSLKKYEYYSATDEILLAHNLAEFKKSLQDVSEEQIMEAPPEIAAPIIDRLGYIKNQELSAAFIALLTKASSADKIQLAHPGFVYLLDRLSSDEAKIIKYLNDYDGFPELQIHAYSTNPPFNGVKANTMTGLESELDIVFPKNIRLYMDNLISLGIISYDTTSSPLKDRAIELEQVYAEEIEHFIKHDVEFYQLSISKSHLWIHPTDLGRKFIEACMPNKTLP